MTKINHISLLLLMPLLQGCGMEFSNEAQLSVKTVGDPYPACKLEHCDKSWPHDLLLLHEAITLNKNIVPVNFLNSENKIIEVSSERAVEVRGFKVIPASLPCREADASARINNIQAPLMRDFSTLDDGEWKICAALVVPPEGRNLYNSPKIVVDKTPPKVSGTVSVSANDTPVPTLSWAPAADNYTAADRIRYRVTVRKVASGRPGFLLADDEPLIFTKETSDPIAITGLVGGNTYEAILTAIDEAGNETDYAGVQILSGPPTVPVLVISDASKSYAKNGDVITWTVNFTYADVVTLSTSDVVFTKSESSQNHSLDVLVTCSGITSCEIAATVRGGSGEISGITIKDGVSKNILGDSAVTSKSMSVVVDTTSPLPPVLADTTKSFNSAFTTSVSQNSPPDLNFKEFRYNLSSLSPDCISGTVYTGPISIPAMNAELRVVACDFAGNISPVSSATYTYDVSGPNPPIVTGSSSYSSSSAFTWSWVQGGSDGAGTYRYRLDADDLSVGASQTTGLTYTATGLPDGVHVLYVSEKDSAGNWSSLGSSSVTIDTIKPLTPSLSVPSKIFNAPFTVTLSQNQTPDLNFKELRYSLSTVLPSCSSGTVYSGPITIPAATTTVTAIACDLAGNSSSVAETKTYTYDITPPLAPVVGSAAAYGGTSTITWTWSPGGGDGDGTFRYKVENSDLSLGATTTTTASFTGSSLSDGAHTLYVQERDAVGNWSASGAYTVIVDTIVPMAPVIADANMDFNASFTTTISQGVPADANFKEFRYNLSASAPTCTSGIAYGSNISIPAETTTLTVVACDMAGNISAASQAVYTYDITPPSAPTVTSVKTYSAVTSVTWTWTGGGGTGTYRYRLDNSDLTSGAATTTIASFTGSSLSEGAHTIYVQERDGVGNWSASGSYAVTVDTTVPQSPIIAEPSKEFDSVFTTTISQGVPADTNFKEFRYNLSASAPTCTSGTLYSSGISIPLASTTLTVVACDLAGNISAASQAVYTYDITPPLAPAVTSVKAYSAATSVTWTWTAGGGGNGTYRYRLDNSDLTSGATTTITASFTGSSLSDGAHTLYVQERDAAGNWSVSGSYLVTVDTTVPQAPVIADTTKDFNAAFTTTLSQGVPADANFKEFRYNLSTSAPTCTSGTTYGSSISIPAATTTVIVVACDMAGNISASSQAVYNYDTTPPSAPTVTSVKAYSATTSVTWTWTAGGGGNGTYRYRLDNSDLTSGTTTTTTASFSGSSLNQGAHTLYVQERDDAGNWSPSGSYAVTVDSIAPQAPVIGDSSKYFNAAFTTSINQGVPADTNFKEFRYNLSASAPNCSSGSVYSSNISIPAATTTLTVVACDLSGNISASSQAVYTYDNTPPSAPSVSSASAYSSATSVTWTWTSGGGGSGTYRYRFDNSDLTTGTTTTTAATFTASSLSDGAHTLYIQERDSAGNWSSSGSYSVNVDTVAPLTPVISHASGNYSFAFNVTISQNGNSDANFKEFRYNLSSSAPSCSTGSVYTGAITISETANISIIACDFVGLGSAVPATASYTMIPPSPWAQPNSTMVWLWSDGIGRTQADARASCASRGARLPEISEYISAVGAGIWDAASTLNIAGGNWYLANGPDQYPAPWAPTYMLSYTDYPLVQYLVFNGGTSFNTFGAYYGNQYTGAHLCVKGITVEISPPPVTSYFEGAPSTRTYNVTYRGATSITLNGGHISLTKTGTANASSVTVAGTGDNRTVTLGGLSGVGTISITLAAETATNSEFSTIAMTSPNSLIGLASWTDTATGLAWISSDGQGRNQSGARDACTAIGARLPEIGEYQTAGANGIWNQRTQLNIVDGSWYLSNGPDTYPAPWNPSYMLTYTDTPQVCFIVFYSGSYYTYGAYYGNQYTGAHLCVRN